jgi:hypothetical protein
LNRFALVALLVPLVALAADPPGKDAKVSSGDPRQPVGVNWQGQLVRATGAGAPNMNASSPAQARLGAEKAALLDAFRNLLAQVKGIQVSSQKTMNNLMENTAVSARVEGLIKNYRVAGKRYFSDNGVEVDVEVPLAMLTEVVDPDSAQQLGAIKTEGEKAATGLVIDARGLKLTPALAPRVLADDGKAVVYSVDTLSLDARKSTGVASYVANLEDAKKVPKVGDKPLVVKALKADGSDVLLAADDTKKLKEINAGFLTEGRVVIVMN